MPLSLARRITFSRVRWTLSTCLCDGSIHMRIYTQSSFSWIPPEKFGHVHKVLALPGIAGVTFALKNCKFVTETIECVGHFIRPSRFKESSHATGARRGLKASTSVTELWSFLELRNVVKRLVPYLLPRDALRLRLEKIPSSYLRAAQPKSPQHYELA